MGRQTEESIAKAQETRRRLGPRYPRSEPARRGPTAPPNGFRFARAVVGRHHPTRDAPS